MQKRIDYYIVLYCKKLIKIVKCFLFNYFYNSYYFFLVNNLDILCSLGNFIDK